MTLTIRHRAITLVEVLVVIGIITILFALIVPAVQRVRGAADSMICREKLRQIGLAMHNYHKDYLTLPPGCSFQNGKDPHPFMSWMTKLLPYLEQDAIYQEALSEYKSNPVFFGPPAHRGLGRPMKIFLCPSDGRDTADINGLKVGFTSYLGVSGTNQDTLDGVLFLDSKVKLAAIHDGLSNTLMVGERPPSARGDIGWWYAGWGQKKNGSADSVLGVKETCQYPGASECSPGPYQFGPGKVDNQCDAFHFWSMHPMGANFVFADCSARFVRYEFATVLPSFATRASSEAVTPAEIE
jgi:hypothetical protein